MLHVTEFDFHLMPEPVMALYFMSLIEMRRSILVIPVRASERDICMYVYCPPQKMKTDSESDRVRHIYMDYCRESESE